MYENMTYDVLLKQMMAALPDTIDKREGSLAFYALAPSAAEIRHVITSYSIHYTKLYETTIVN